MFLHFFWDFDGTLFDSYPHMTRAFQLALREYGVEQSTEEILTHFKLSTIGKSAKWYCEKYGLPDDLLDKFHAYNATNREDIIPFPYVREVCRSIVAKGGKNYLYTHSNQKAWEKIHEYGFEDTFCDRVTSENQFPLKPAPDALEYLIEKHKISKEQAIMVGDRDIDLLSGTNAGIAGCLFDPDKYFEDFEVEYRVYSMKELEDKLVK